jgi:hypothetical protein
MKNDEQLGMWNEDDETWSRVSAELDVVRLC